MAFASGWLTLGLVLLAGVIPLGYRWKIGRRADPQSRPISMHVTLGIATAAAAFAHALFSVMSLGSAKVVAAGNLALALGGAALLVLMAHVGIGLQLRNPKLRKGRKPLRKKHLVTAITITLCAIAHTVMLLVAAP